MSYRQRNSLSTTVAGDNDAVLPDLTTAGQGRQCADYTLCVELSSVCLYLRMVQQPVFQAIVIWRTMRTNRQQNHHHAGQGFAHFLVQFIAIPRMFGNNIHIQCHAQPRVFGGMI